MTTKKELQELSNNIGKAIFAYRNAVAVNLKESGKEHNVIGDDEEYNGICLKIRDDDSVDTALIDKVRWNEERECVEYHCSEWNYQSTDDWTNIAWLGEEIDYIYDAIEW